MKKPRGKPFQPGNPGGPGRGKGRKNSVTLETQQLLAEKAKALTTKCMLLAMQGHPVALRLCMERLMAPRRDTTVRVRATRIKTAADVDRALAQVWKRIAGGEITPAEGELLARVLMARTATIETTEFEPRLRRVEETLTTKEGTP
jgi:hypothetical protein